MTGAGCVCAATLLTSVGSSSQSSSLLRLVMNGVGIATESGSGSHTPYAPSPPPQTPSAGFPFTHGRSQRLSSTMRYFGFVTSADPISVPAAWGSEDDAEQWQPPSIAT